MKIHDRSLAGNRLVSTRLKISLAGNRLAATRLCGGLGDKLRIVTLLFTACHLHDKLSQNICSIHRQKERALSRVLFLLINQIYPEILQTNCFGLLCQCHLLSALPNCHDLSVAYHLCVLNDLTMLTQAKIHFRLVIVFLK